MTHHKTIDQLSQELTNKALTPQTLYTEYTQRIQNVEPHIDAFLSTFDFPETFNMKNNSKLWGIPYANKAIISVQGKECNAASKILEGYIAEKNATVTDKLQAAGALVIGNTNMDEFAQGSSNEHSAYKTTKNPWDIKTVPGGSSGGSAAAVAADECVFALGTDTGGSIRQPAAFCGITGLKPSYGRVSRYGVMSYASSLDTVGVFSKTVQDSAIVLDVITGQDEKDMTSIPSPDISYEKELKNFDITGKKICYIQEFLDLPGLDPQLKKDFENSLQIAKDKGAIIESVSFPLIEAIIPTYYIIAKSEGSTNYHRYDGIRYGQTAKDSKNIKEIYTKSRSEFFGDEVKRCILLGTTMLSEGSIHDYYIKAAKVRRLIREFFDNLSSQYFAILSPVTPTLPFTFGEKTKNPLEMYAADIFTIPASLAGIPAISIPTKRYDNFAGSLQIMGKYKDELSVLQLAYFFEQEFQFERLHYKV